MQAIDFLLLFATWIYWLIAFLQVRSFFSLQKGDQAVDFSPPVSILKPVRGLDAEAFENLSSFCKQDYPEYEILIGVEDHNDPVIPVVEQLIKTFPDLKIKLFVVKTSGTNRKVGLLEALSRQATYGILVASDSDMRVRPDYLRRVVAPLTDPKVGLVTCPYRGLLPITYTARLEALHMGVIFLPSVIVASRLFKFHFGMGSTEAVRKADLLRIGGFASISDYLADDFELAIQMRKTGLRTQLSDYIVDCVLGPTTFPEQWKREVRWAQCNRVSRSIEYPGLLLTYSTPLAILFALVYGPGHPLSWLLLAFTLAWRMAFAYFITGYTGDLSSRRWLFWLPIREMLSALIWGAGFLSDKVSWRGCVYLLKEDGCLVPITKEALSLRRMLLIPVQALVVLVDAILRRIYHIHAFNEDQHCLLRYSLGRNSRDLALSDGTRVQEGDPILELHFWNERLPQMPSGGPDLGWALAFRRGMIYSLEELAAFIKEDPQTQGVRAIHGDPPFFVGDQQQVFSEYLRHWGFDCIPENLGDGFKGQFALFWENVYTYGMLMAFNPASLKGRHWSQPQHMHIWISREKMMAEYLKPIPAGIFMPQPQDVQAFDFDRKRDRPKERI